MRYAFLYLDADHHRKVPVERVDGDRITIPVFEKVSIVVRVDERDKRALVVFDGDIPRGGLPRSGTQVWQQNVKLLRCQKEHVRKQRPFELCHPHHPRHDTQDGITVLLRRRVLLLPAGRTVLVRYRPDSLEPVYCFTEVMCNDHGHDVTFRNTDY